MQISRTSPSKQGGVLLPQLPRYLKQYNKPLDRHSTIKLLRSSRAP